MILERVIFYKSITPSSTSYDILFTSFYNPPYKEYDSYGNWIKREIYVKGNLVEFETRDITYYE